jgi:hypothetical protein
VERVTGTHWIEGWVGPRAALDDLENKFLTLPGLELLPFLSQNTVIVIYVAKLDLVEENCASNLMYESLENLARNKHYQKRVVWRLRTTSTGPEKGHILPSPPRVNLLKPNGYICTTDFNILILCITPTKCICKFDMVLTINSCCFPK